MIKINKKIIIFFSVLLLIILLVLGYFYFFGKKASDIQKVVEKVDIVEKIEEKTVNKTKIYIKSSIPENDKDLDGVDDAIEEEMGLTPGNFDSDGDGLGDKIEIEIGTDPGNWDTDGDGFSDTLELDGGYNPLGPGKLEN